MKIIQELKNKRITAIKNGDVVIKDYLGVLIASFEKDFLKDGQDDEKIIKKLANENKKAVELYESFKTYDTEKYAENIEKARLEMHIIANLAKEFMPTQLTDDEIKTIISQNGLNDVKSAMAYFKTNHSGQYDSKHVISLLK